MFYVTVLGGYRIPTENHFRSLQTGKMLDARGHPANGLLALTVKLVPSAIESSNAAIARAEALGSTMTLARKTRLANRSTVGNSQLAVKSPAAET
jgi:hypothetical protein